MIEVIRYTPDKRKEWDDFIDMAKNGTFLFKRCFMEYHSDRFNDYSLMVYEKSKLCLILPANIDEFVIYSHQGLTFGGMISLNKNTSIQIISYFNAINHHLNNKGIKQVVYKSIPQIYKSHFGQEDEYLMFRANAVLTSCNLSSVLDFSLQPKFSRNRIRNKKKALAHEVTISESNNYKVFWDIMVSNMGDKYDSSPTHSHKEMELLKSCFPENITLYTSNVKDVIIGGVVLFIFNNVVKVQYAHASEHGKSIGAIDALYFHIIEKYKSNYKYIDFGSSNMENGRILQESLISQKEGFGARGVVYNTYKYNTDNCIN